MKYLMVANFCLLWVTFLVLDNANQHEASVLSKLKNVFASNKTTTNNTNSNYHDTHHQVESSQKNFSSNENSHSNYNPERYDNNHYNVNNNNNNGHHDADNGIRGTRDGDTRIPFWNIAHMVNSIDQIEQMVGNGSNGIEIDVSFNDQGHPVESYHGFPCDCGRHCHLKDDFVQMIRHISQICVPPASSNLQLVLFDLKLSKLDEQKKIVAGRELARILHENLYNNYAQASRNHQNMPSQYQQNFHLQPKVKNPYHHQKSQHYQRFSGENSGLISANPSAYDDNMSHGIRNDGLQARQPDHQQYDHHQAPSLAASGNVLDKPPVRVVISINYVNDSSLIQSFMRYVENNKLDSMRKLVGFDVGMNDKLTNISSMWDHLNGITRNIWQGDGLTNCVNLVRPTDRLREAISMRNNQGQFRKVYYWTVDVLYQLRSILRLGPDAVLTNQPQRIVQVLEEPEFKQRYRLATAYDDPFAQYWIEPTAGKMSLPSVEDAKETIENVKNTSMNFIKTLPDGVSAAVKKVISSAVNSNSHNNNNN